MTTRTIERKKVVKLTEPPKRWRNKVRVLISYKSRQTGEHRRPGDIVVGANEWPSKEIAETKFLECARDPQHIVALGHAEYLGAFPVEAS